MIMMDLWQKMYSRRLLKRILFYLKDSEMKIKNSMKTGIWMKCILSKHVI